MPRRRIVFTATTVAALHVAALAQTQPAPVALPAPAADDAQKLAPVEVTGTRPDETEERRRSTAAKIVIGRDEIDRFGDSTLGDVLKRLPGVTLGGRPGRGGAIRMRGLGSGYTQILLDGQRIPPGFSLDSLAPDQVERIEILRAPTAETGARAIAGTINIVTRGGYTRRVNDLKLTASHENGSLRPQVAWTRNVDLSPFVVNWSLSGQLKRQDVSGVETTRDDSPATGETIASRREDDRSTQKNRNVAAGSRLEWRGEQGIDQVVLAPFGLYSKTPSRSDKTLEQRFGDLPPPYDRARTDADNAFSLVRLNTQWNRRIEGGRVEAHGSGYRSKAYGNSLRTETTGGAATRTLANDYGIEDTSATGTLKLTQALLDAHSGVAGAEVESNRRQDRRRTLQDGERVLVQYGDVQKARSTRIAVYAQDEWPVGAQWAAHAGLRYERIETRGSGLVDAAGDEVEPKNTSRVWTPLLHAVWKPDPAARDQVRISLTRSYRSPTLQQLIGRPRVNTNYPVPGPNTPTDADIAGNPDLKPELATGLDLAFERYLPASGILSANVFVRRLRDYLRSTTELEAVPYSSTPRYVTRPRNVGKAQTAGIELEAKLRASEVWREAPRIDLRANASAFRSSVKAVSGRNDRLDQQPDWTANAGADYRFGALPLTLGGNLNFTPAYTTRLSETQSGYLGRKLVADAYALWTFSPAAALRVSLSNLDPHDYEFGSSVDGPDRAGVPVRETAATTQPTFVNVQVRLELKL